MKLAKEYTAKLDKFSGIAVGIINWTSDRIEP